MEGVRRGIGFGTYVEGTGVGPFESAQVQIDSQGNVVVYSGCAPHGQGLETTMSQVVADLFGIPPEKVIFRAGDTALVPYGVGTFASRSVITAGAAIHVAASRLQERLKSIAAEMLEIQSEDLELVDGEVRARGVPARSVSLRDLYRAAAPGPRARLPQGIRRLQQSLHVLVQVRVAQVQLRAAVLVVQRHGRAVLDRALDEVALPDRDGE